MIIGIDPGVSGALSTFIGGDLVTVQDLPMIEVKVGKGKRRQLVPGTLADMLEGCPAGTHAYLEQVSSRPGEGAVGAFSFGRGFGQIEGVLAALSIPFTLVTPAKWKKAIGCPADKGQARMVATRLFPKFADSFKRVKDDGRAEAALIGLYGVNL